MSACASVKFADDQTRKRPKSLTVYGKAGRSLPLYTRMLSYNVETKRGNWLKYTNLDVKWESLSNGRPFSDIRVDPASVRNRRLGITRVIDIAGSLFGMVALSPVFLVVILLILADTWGSPFYIDGRRLGHLGRPFPLIKFRTMVSNAETALDVTLRDPNLANEFERYRKMYRDPRITRVGAILRRSSLDETPQLLNVLLGHMSLVGPRPIVGEELGHYTSEQRRLLLSVKPGLTGLWQISGRSNIAYPERAALELRYVQTRSLAGDLDILRKTVSAVLRGRGAV